MAVALAGVSERAPVGRETRPALFAGHTGDALDVLSIHRGYINIAARNDGDFLAGGRQDEIVDIRRARGALAVERGLRDIDFDPFRRARAVAEPVEIPIPGEREIVGLRDRERAHGIASELRDLNALAVGERQLPDVHRARRLAEIEDVAARRPDGVAALVDVGGQPLVFSARRFIQPYLTRRARYLPPPEGLFDAGACIQ